MRVAGKKNGGRLKLGGPVRQPGMHERKEKKTGRPGVANFFFGPLVIPLAVSLFTNYFSPPASQGVLLARESAWRDRRGQQRPRPLSLRAVRAACMDGAFSTSRRGGCLEGNECRH